MLDDTDRRILRQYQADPEMTVADLAERCGLTQATCWRRLEAMLAGSVIEGLEAVINWAALGYSVEVSLRITLEKSVTRAFDEFLAAAREIPEVVEAGCLNSARFRRRECSPAARPVSAQTFRRDEAARCSPLRLATPP